MRSPTLKVRVLTAPSNASAYDSGRGGSSALTRCTSPLADLAPLLIPSGGFIRNMYHGGEAGVKRGTALDVGRYS